jgi:flagellar biosynthetic protein FliR
MDQSLQLFDVSAAYLSGFALAAVRVLAAIGMNPVLGSTRVPLQARIGLGLFATLIIFPPGAPVSPTPRVGPLEIGGELLLGLLAGFVVALVFGAVQSAGALLSSGSGFNFGGLLDPAQDIGSGGLERFFSTFALLVFLEINGHHLSLAGLHELFDKVPVGTFGLPSGPDLLVDLSAGLFSAALKMALPALAALLLADLGLAVLARVAPQFNLFALGLPIKLGVGLAALIVGLPVILPRMVALFRAIPANMLGVAG